MSEFIKSTRLVLAALALLTRWAYSADTALEPEFKGQGICQFALHGYVIAPQSEAIINQTVDKLIEQHQFAFGFRRDPEFRLRMRVYNRFEDFTNATALRSLTNLQGVYISESKEIVTYRQEIPGSIGTTLLHEASHAILDHQYDRLKPWLMEGAAEYFSLTLARNPQNTSLLQRRWALLNLWLREDKLPSLEKLLNASHAEWKQMPSDLAYGASWSLFQLLMSSDANKRIMRRMVLEWQQTFNRSIDCAAQVERLYPGGLAGLDRDWRRWIDKSSSRDVYKTTFQGKGICRFALHGYDLSPAVESSLNQQAQALLAKHRTVFGLEAKPGYSVRIRLFGAWADYARYATNSLVSGWDVKAGELARVKGYYSPLTEEIVTWAQDRPEQLMHTVLFLANNALVKEELAKIPRWVSSGCPEYFLGAAQTPGHEAERLNTAWHRAGLDAASLQSLRSMLDDTSSYWQNKDVDNDGKTEVLCWAVFQFFCANEENQQVLKSLMKNLQASPGRLCNTVPQIERLYPGGWSTFEQRIKKWLGY